MVCVSGTDLWSVVMKQELRDEGGFTLIEGLLASAILGTSLLGIAAVQGMALSQNVDSNELTLANNLAADIIERVQFNRRNVRTYSNLNVTPTVNNCPAQTNVPQPNNTMTTRGDCLQWQALLTASLLTGVTGAVTLNPVPPAVDPNGLNQTTVTVRITWTSRRLGALNTLSVMTVVAPE